MKDFRALKVWQKSHQTTLNVYRVTQLFPREELYGLNSQTRRASTSIAANIAEGCGRGTDADFARFLQIAMGSASELEYHLLLAFDLGFLEALGHQALASDVAEVKRMLTAFIQKLKVDC
jgi:four helix bundle protein